MTTEERTDGDNDQDAEAERPAPVRRLVGSFGEAILSAESFRGEWTVVVDKSHLVQAMTLLKDDPELAYQRLVDVSAVDYLERDDTRQRYGDARFMVVYHLYSHRPQVDPGLQRLRVKTPVSEQDPVVPTVTTVWEAANWPEREVFDMFGIRFDGHPDPRRILMPDDFEAHPLQKDYPLKGRGERASFDFEQSPSHPVAEASEADE